MTASEAAGALNVSRQTLYAYVSRGAIRSVPAPDGRSHRYHAADIARLIAAKDPLARQGRVARAALDWGLPILDSAITEMTARGPCYRGRPAIDLAGHASLEEVARLLWDCADADPFAAAPPVDRLTIGVDLERLMPPGLMLPGLTPIDRCLVLLPAVAPRWPFVWSGERAELLVAGAALLRLLTRAVVPTAMIEGPTHEVLARAWRLDPAGADLVRAALVLLADHELNASTFAVRVVASTGAPLHAAVAGGLAALLGPRHGGETARVEAFLDEAGFGERGGQARQTDPADAVTRRLRRGERVPGFGHALYPEGDPRATALLDRLAAAIGRDPWLDRLAGAVEAATGKRPTIDFALVSMTRRLGLPDGTALAIFALGRTAGWIAHALEQRETGSLIRPRAHYVGPTTAAHGPRD
ncbi:MAG TPA: citrate synthase family protein [Stellaceae bacterium]|nr:citrate synthase family protein [Stellaceae bacterium]